MVELKVEPDKLPKEEDLRSRYFLSTYAIAVSDQDIRLVGRQAFISISQTEMNLGMLMIVGGMRKSMEARKAAAAAANAAPAEAQPAGAPTAAPGPPTGNSGRPAPGGGSPGRGPGGRRGRPGG